MNSLLSLHGRLGSIGQLSMRETPPNVQYNNLTNLTAVSGWGMINRNPAYSGFALRVEDAASPGTTTDIAFDANGRVTGTPPYGSNTRVVIVYDQWGSDNLTALYTQGVGVAEESIDYSSWKLLFTGAGGLLSTALTGAPAPWELARPVVVSGFERTTSAGLQIFWGVQSDANFMEIGLWQENEDPHWRVNGSTQSDWLNADWNIDASVVRNVLSRFIQDYSNTVSPATAYFNGAAAGTRDFGYPIGYSANKPLGWGTWSGIGSNLTGNGFEVHVFDTAAPISAENIAILDGGINNFNAIPPDEQAVAAHSVYIVEGQAASGRQLVSVHNIYVVET